jgi:hypothetical protein
VDVLCEGARAGTKNFERVWVAVVECAGEDEGREGREAVFTFEQVDVRVCLARGRR